MTLRYPLDMGSNIVGGPDYVRFQPRKYRANSQRQATSFQDRDQQFGAPTTAQAVVLYMPNSTPGVANGNDWGSQDFDGPIGDFRKQAGAAAASIANDTRNLGDVLNQTVNSLNNFGGNDLGSLARQTALETINQTGLFNATGEQFLAMSRGKVYNPNVELLYTQPKMREFNFQFRFVPKNIAEAVAVNRIILHFKKWSSPLEVANGFMEVPYIWEVTYMTGANPNKNMNRFKKAACTNVQVQANPQTTMHVAHDDGMPIETSLSLQFKEVDIITRQDHTDIGGQGF